MKRLVFALCLMGVFFAACSCGVSPPSPCAADGSCPEGLVCAASGAQRACYATSDVHSVGGTVTGLAGSGLVLQDNGGDDLALSASGSFTFATRVASGTSYSATVEAQPTSPTQTCVVQNGSGTIGANDVTNVAVTCTTNTYYVGGTVTGLVGSGLVLQDNGGDDLALSASGSFTFATPVASGTSYSVTVKAQPSGQACAVQNGSGTIASANITSAAVSCVRLPWSSVASGYSHALGITTDGTLWAWGLNSYGQLGDGTTTNRLSPVQVGSGFAQVAAGYLHTVALKADGTLWAWGYNGFGQLGDGTTTQRLSPVQVGSGFAQVAAGYLHTVALKADGTLWAWGYNYYGQLGDGTTTNRLSPVQVGSG